MVILFSTNCNTKSKPQQKLEPLQNLNIDTKIDWGGNFKINIVEIRTEDSMKIYKLCSIDNGLQVGFELQMPNQTNSFESCIEFKSLGEISNNFLKSLYKIYGLKESENFKFVNRHVFNYAGLNDIPYKGNGQKRIKEINYIKVFFEESGLNEYAELYLNIDEKNRVIEVEEKDFIYRPYVAMFLTQE